MTDRTDGGKRPRGEHDPAQRDTAEQAHGLLRRQLFQPPLLIIRRSPLPALLVPGGNSIVAGARESATGAFGSSPRALGPETHACLAHSPTSPSGGDIGPAVRGRTARAGTAGVPQAWQSGSTR